MITTNISFLFDVMTFHESQEQIVVYLQYASDEHLLRCGYVSVEVWSNLLADERRRQHTYYLHNIEYPNFAFQNTGGVHSLSSN